MKALFLASVAFVGLVGASALASDLPTKAPINKTPIAAPPYNWSGFYVGANFGGGWTNGSLNIPGNNFYGGITELIGGVQAGYNFQSGHLLLGVEGDFDWASFNHPTLPTPTLSSVSNHWMSTVAGRVGLVNDRWLVFAKLGGGWAQSSAIVNLPGSPSWSGSSTNGGWLIGGGIEYGFKAGRSFWCACKRRRPAEGITEPDRGSRQRAVPEQHQFQRWAVQSHAGNTQHSASRTDPLERGMERNLAHHHSGGEPARSADKQQHQWYWRHYPIVVPVTGAPG